MALNGLRALAVAGVVALTPVASANLIITGVVDGPLTGGQPKAVELYVTADIADLSIYGIGSANNGGGTDGEEFTLSGSATAGSFIWITNDAAAFNQFFGFAATFAEPTATAINGDDAVELFMNGSVIDVFGEIDMDGTGTPWEYMDGWAYRSDGTGPDGTTFQLPNWYFSGINALDGELTNDTAATPFPIGTYSPIPAPACLALLTLAGACGRRRRRTA